MSEQIIGNYKEFVVIERAVIDNMEAQAQLKLTVNSERPLSEASIEARTVLDVIRYVKENNIYNQDFKIKG
jgi:hypothetical protein